MQRSRNSKPLSQACIHQSTWMNIKSFIMLTMRHVTMMLMKDMKLNGRMRPSTITVISGTMNLNGISENITEIRLIINWLISLQNHVF